MDIWALSDLCTPWCIHVVSTLKVANHLDAGVTQIDDLASACGAHPESLQRVVRHLIGKGLFAEPSPGVFALNDDAKALLDPGLQLGLDLDSFGGRMARSWSTLLTAVETGAPAYEEVFGRPFWEDLQAHPQIGEAFDHLMGPQGHGAPDPDIPLASGWDSVRTVVDVGGGTGALLAAILQAHPGIRGVLVDQPPTVARSGALLEAAGVSDRVTAVGQSFFDPLPVGGDVYLLKSILSDWPDREAREILARCADAAGPHGRVVLVNGATEADPPPPELLMMVLLGGKLRSLREFRELAASANLEIVAAVKKKDRFTVECRPVFPAVGC